MTYGEVDVQIQVFLTSALVGGEWLDSRIGRFTPGVKASLTYWIGGSVDLRTGLIKWKEEKYCPYPDSNSEPSAFQPVASRYTDCAIPTLESCLICEKTTNFKTRPQAVYSNVNSSPFFPCFFSLALQPQLGPWPTSMKFSVPLQFTRSWTIGRTPWTGDQLVARPLPVHKLRKTHIH
jgi:hypothetical protein